MYSSHTSILEVKKCECADCNQDVFSSLVSGMPSINVSTFMNIAKIKLQLIIMEIKNFKGKNLGQDTSNLQNENFNCKFKVYRP